MMQNNLFEEEEEARALLDRLLQESRLYKNSKNYQELLEFVAKFRNMAPFNAMLLQIQKPGLTYAASRADWQNRFGRQLKDAARPLLIMWPFGPVALVYDVLDTDGKALPLDAEMFPVRGEIGQFRLDTFQNLMIKKAIDLQYVDQGDGSAGLVRTLRRTEDGKSGAYRILVNRNHPVETQFVTLMHELAHLFLGHLGGDDLLKIKDRVGAGWSDKELEAESVAYLLAKRQGLEPRSQTYLAGCLESEEEMPDLDLYAIMTATNKIEGLLGLSIRISM